MREKRTENKQFCVFCMRKDATMPIYSAGLGRMGICFTCAKNAVKAFRAYHEKENAAEPMYTPQSLFETHQDQEDQEHDTQ